MLSLLLWGVALAAALVPPPQEQLLLRVAAATDRGQSATSTQRAHALALIRDLELNQDTTKVDPTLLNGKWQLVYATEAVYRSSPFFSAFKQSCKSRTTPIGVPSGAIQPGDSLAEAILAITDAIPFYDVGNARQEMEGILADCFGYSVSDDGQTASSGPSVEVPSDTDSSSLPSSEALLTSKIDLSISRLFGLPVQSSVMTTTATINFLPTDDGGEDIELELKVQDTSAAQSTISALVPLLDNALQKFPSGSALDMVSKDSSIVRTRCTYLTDHMRVARPVLNLGDRGQDASAAFVYIRESS